MTMRKLQILGVSALGLIVLAHDAMAQRRGAAGSGVRGAP
jgi:hypothetical protein